MDCLFKVIMIIVLLPFAVKAYRIRAKYYNDYIQRKKG